MNKNTEYMYLEFPSGAKRKENLYLYGTDDDPVFSKVRLTFRGEQPHTIYVPNQVADDEVLIHMMANGVPNAEVRYFGDVDE